MVKTLLKSVREFKKTTLLTPLFIAFEVILECIIPLIMAKLIDDMTGNTMTPIFKYGTTLLIMAVFSLIFGVLAGKTAATASCGFAKNLRQDLYFKIQDYSFHDIDKFSSASLITRMTTDVSNVQMAFQMCIRIAVRTPLLLIFSVIMSMSISVKMSFIFLGLIPIIGVSLFAIAFKVMPIFKRIFKKYDALNNSVQENIDGIRVVKSFVREDFEREKFGRTSGEVREDFTYVDKILALNTPIMSFCMYMSMLLVSFFGSQLIINSHETALTTGELSTLLTYGAQILSSIMMLSAVFVMMTISQESAKRICEVLEYEPTLVNNENGITEVANGSITFDKVYFRYSEKNNVNALTDINIEIPSGATVGIIGGTGASKTTLIQLISRLYDVTEGSVKVGGVDVRDYDLTALRQEVSVVLQKNVLFSGTIKENLRWGNKDASDEEIERVCKLAQADEFVQQMPDKYDTYIERGGTNVSGGQKQRLCIARALLKKPKVLILDDSTSAVDTKTDALIRRAFKEEIPQTTKLIIAQRVSSVEDADVILVLEDGRIVEQGTHQELVDLNGIYSEIYYSQTKGKEEA